MKGTRHELEALFLGGGGGFFCTDLSLLSLSLSSPPLVVSPFPRQTTSRLWLRGERDAPRCAGPSGAGRNGAPTPPRRGGSTFQAAAAAGGVPLAGARREGASPTPGRCPCTLPHLAASRVRAGECAGAYKDGGRGPESSLPDSSRPGSPRLHARQPPALSKQASPQGPPPRPPPANPSPALRPAEHQP